MSYDDEIFDKPFDVERITVLRNEISRRAVRLRRFSFYDAVRIIDSEVPSPAVTLRFDREKCHLPFTIVVIYNPFVNNGEHHESRDETIKFRAKFYCGAVTEEMDFEFDIKMEERHLVEPKVEESDTLKCSICVTNFSDTIEELKPKMLTGCGHTLCGVCIKNVETPPQIRCPTCMKVTTTRPEDLPFNWTLRTIIRERAEEAARAEKIDEPIVERVEDPIVPCFEDPYHESTVYCAKCVQTYCDRCFKSAHQPKVMSQHKSVPVDEKPTLIPMCSAHPDVQAVSVCRNKDCSKVKFMCDDCHKTKHDKHTVENISDEIEANTTFVQEFFKVIEASEKKSVEKLHLSEDCCKSFRSGSSTFHEIKKEIGQFFDRKKFRAWDGLRNFANREREKYQQHLNETRAKMELFEEVKKEVQKTLKRKTNLHDVEELRGKKEKYAKFFEEKEMKFVKLNHFEIPQEGEERDERIAYFPFF